MKVQISNNLPLARKFNRTFRYIDDLLTLNNPGFCTFTDQIYPKELNLKRTTEGKDNCSYLDLNISIEAGRYILLTFTINVKPLSLKLSTHGQ